MKKIFMPFKIKDMEVKNRFVRSATYEFISEGDFVNEQLINTYRNLARNEIGLIITGNFAVHPRGKLSKYQYSIYDNQFVEDIERLVDAVHEHESKIFIQLSHAGRQTKEKFTGGKIVAPSCIPSAIYKDEPIELGDEGIYEIIDAFALGAYRAKLAGADGIQLHGAHGYLIHQFLSPITNKRQDEWGGSLENRMRFLLEIIKACRKEVGEDYIIGIKLSSEDLLEEGLTSDDAILIAKILEQNGIDFMEISGGLPETAESSPIRTKIIAGKNEGYFIEAACKIRQNMTIPVSVVGGFRSLEFMNRLIEEEGFDMISLSRPFIAEPDLIEKFKRELSDKSKCISCNKCFDPKGMCCKVHFQLT
ncbi:tRNA-dihydrouridine synthase [Anaerosolibacter sp.]|uniref:oxidoreductase n=1 Tax=Anaerosolibacter sp. TaxID=1872527 RepID=UPI0039EFFBCE